MTFPNFKYPTASDFAAAYFEELAATAKTLDRERMDRAAEILLAACKSRKTIYSCGNGGSAAISNHLHCDFLKGAQVDTAIKPRVISLSSAMETLTAIANDVSFDEVFVYQLSRQAEPGDVLVTISSSGDSENIVKAAKWARENDLHVIALTGFDGGRSAALANVNLHVGGDNYGVIEDIHQSLMHILAQFIRVSNMPESLINQRKF